MFVANVSKLGYICNKHYGLRMMNEASVVIAPRVDDAMVEELRNKVRSSVGPLITGDYAVLDLPYYDNPGDTLIWEGTLEFLKEIRGKCRYAAGKDNYVPGKVKPGLTVLLQGGGNFGDLWPAHQEFRKRVIESCRDNRVIVLPQSVHYQDYANLKADAEFFKAHPGVIICVRDRKSQEILEADFPNRILLVPDMAFFADVAKYRGAVASESGRTLLAKRVDKEAPADADFSVVPGAAEIRDWPMVETYPASLYEGLEHKLRRCRRVKKWFGVDLAARTVDRYWHRVMRPAYVREAVEFIDRYDEVWSTRLHVTILSMLLGKRVHVIDNSYNKTRNFLETWFPEK